MLKTGGERNATHLKRRLICTSSCKSLDDWRLARDLGAGSSSEGLPGRL
jgi:hypothetical protein